MTTDDLVLNVIPWLFAIAQIYVAMRLGFAPNALTPKKLRGVQPHAYVVGAISHVMLMAVIVRAEAYGLLLWSVAFIMFNAINWHRAGKS